MAADPRAGMTAADLAGLWRRRWLRAPEREDATSTVLWRQAPDGLCVDLRLPADLPDLTAARSLAALDAAELTALTRCEGFAGVAEVSGDVCTWRRAVNWRGPEDGPDVGRLTVTAEGLLETGVHADYAELWTMRDPAPCRGLALTEGDRLAVVVWSESAFSLGRGRPHDREGAPLSGRVAAALAAGDRDALAAAFDAEFSEGVIEGGLARVVRSTAPPRVGATAFAAAALERTRPILTEQHFDGATRAVAWDRISP